MTVSKSSFEEGVASLYAFEKELPKISETKSKGLKEFYNKVMMILITILLSTKKLIYIMPKFGRIY